MIRNVIEFLISPKFLLSISAMVLIVAGSKRLNNYLDVRRVFKEQLALFKGDFFQLFLFFGVPILLATAVVQIKCVDKEIINNLNVVLSIMISMFFAMLSIIGSLSKRNREGFDRLLGETINTIIFECVICILILLVSFTVLFIDNYKVGFTLTAVSWVLYYLVFVVVLNIFVVIKRLKVIFDEKD